MKKIFVLLALGLVVMNGTGCATIVSRSKYMVSVDSNPQGAMVTVKDKRGTVVAQETTPAVLRLRAKDRYFRGAQYRFLFEKEGFQPREELMGANLDPWYFGNIVFGGLIGMAIVDPATGAMWKLDKNLRADLLPVGAAGAGWTSYPAVSSQKSPRPAAQGVEASSPYVSSRAPIFDKRPTDQPAPVEDLNAPVGFQPARLEAAVNPVEKLAVTAESLDLVRRLKELKELRDAGILTEREYESKRSLLVDKL